MTLRDQIEHCVVSLLMLAALCVFWATVLPWLWDFLLEVKR